MAAIDHGADAVYIGGPAFGAREKAGNSIEDIEKLCCHAALFDAKVYVTLNTLLYEKEMEPARQLAWDCWNAGVDALIVQDLNLLQLDLPPISLHASTQCDNLTVERVKELEQLGFEQVVLGRELTIDEIREIRRQTTVPLEFFVHGSLCVSHSGQCYLSQYIGNRSANRGACAQPCRLPWDLLDADGKVMVKGKHLLCLKDMNNSAHLEELMDAGITSFKIEGRLKDADYVKNITAYYRQQLDAIFKRRPEYVQASVGHCQYAFEVNPKKSFNRGFTDYFIHGRQPNIGSPNTPKSMGEYIGEVKWCNSVQMEIATDKDLHNGDGLCFLNQDDELIGIRADVAKGNKVSCNRPHGATRGTKIFRNYDIEWQRQVDASKGNRKIDIDLVLTETEDGFELRVKSEKLKVNDDNSSLFTFHFSLRRIAAIFLAAAFLGGLAFGAYRAFSPAKETPTEEKDSSLFILHSSLPSPVRFSDIRLDSILTVVSAHYGKAVSFRNEEAKGLKFIMAWNPDSSLTSFIDGLNMFDGLLLTLQQDTIFVETTEVREGAE